MQMRKRVEQLRLHLGHLAQRLVDPRQKIQKLQENFRTGFKRLCAAMLNSQLHSRRKLETQVQLLNSLSPLQVIGRGYSLTRLEDGSIVRSVKQASPGTIVKTELADGAVRSKILGD